VSYNSLDASFDGEQHNDGEGAPFAQRRPGQLALLGSSDAAVIGIQEGNSCLVKIPRKPCYRQIDSLAAGLQSRYALADTDASATGPNRYAGNYILYDPNVVEPVDTGGHFILDHELTGLPNRGGGGRYAAYQAFRLVQTGATMLFVSAHLATPRGHEWDNVRGEETRSMIQQAAAYAASLGVGPIVYTGDFNSYPHEYEKVDEPGNEMRAAGYLDGIQVAQELVNAQYDSINGLSRIPPKGHGSADHVFVSAGVGVQSWRELLHLSKGKFAGTIPSDHNPVVSGVEIPY
jgi:endonuclease/exonuclease/phosphatase family metal-dependent hydrolase